MGTVRTPPAGRLHREDGQPGEVVVGVGVLLEAVRVHRLAEVAGAVEEPHPHERHAQVARRLAVVAGEDAEAAGVDAERLVDPELHREVGDRPRHLHALLGVPARAAAVLVEGLDDVGVEPHELRVGEQAHPLLRLDVDQQLDGVVVAPPGLGVDPGEEPVGPGRPAPPVVVGQVPQPLEGRRQLDVGHVKRADVHEIAIASVYRPGESRPIGAAVGLGRLYPPSDGSAARRGRPTRRSA